jgi:hypothetical protein
MRAGQLTALGVALLALAAFAPTPARAEPFFMVRAGAKCNDCHVNQTGGGMRTAFAHIHAHDILRDLQLLPIPKGVERLDPQLHSHVRIGTDVRIRDTMLFEDKPNAQGEVKNNRAWRKYLTSNDFDVPQARFYFLLDLWPEIASLYVDESFAGGAENRELFGLFRGFLPYDFYVKGGRFYPTFGLRPQDDAPFIRSATGFTFQNPDEGVEIGFAPGPFFLAMDVVDGIEGDTDVMYTVNGYTLIDEVPVVQNVLAGMSYARQSNKRWVMGWYGGANLWKFTGIGEFDLIDDRTVGSLPARDRFAAYAELNFLMFDWLNARGTFNFLDVRGDRNRTQYTIGLEPFIDKFFQPRIQYRINNGPPSQPAQNTAELWFELHIFL